MWSRASWISKLSNLPHLKEEWPWLPNCKNRTQEAWIHGKTFRKKSFWPWLNHPQALSWHHPFMKRILPLTVLFSLFFGLLFSAWKTQKPINPSKRPTASSPKVQKEQQARQKKFILPESCLLRSGPMNYQMPEMPREFVEFGLQTVANIDWPISGVDFLRKTKSGTSIGIIEGLLQGTKLQRSIIRSKSELPAMPFYQALVRLGQKYLKVNKEKRRGTTDNPLTWDDQESHARGLEISRLAQSLIELLWRWKQMISALGAWLQWHIETGCWNMTPNGITTQIPEVKAHLLSVIKEVCG